VELTMTTDLAAHATGTLLRLREGTGPRANLRRGHSPSTEQYAYPYLAPLWTQHGAHFRVPLLRVGALAATATDVANDPSVPLGVFLRRAALAGVDGGADAHDRALERVGRRLVWAQTGDVEKLHMALRQLVGGSRLAHPAVSWHDVIDTYLWWDQPDPARRRDHRRRLLEKFYGHNDPPAAPTSTTPDPDANTPAPA
jgi:CRISPR type I-E-associated protein CasB/Cse2